MSAGALAPPGPAFGESRTGGRGRRGAPCARLSPSSRRPGSWVWRPHVYAGVRVQTWGQTRCPCPFRGDCWGLRNVLAPPLTLLSGCRVPTPWYTRQGGPGLGLSIAALRDLSLGMRTVPAVTKQPGHSCCESGTGDLGLPSARFSEAAPGPGLRHPCCAVLGAQHRVGGGPESVGRVDKWKKQQTQERRVHRRSASAESLRPVTTTLMFSWLKPQLPPRLVNVPRGARFGRSFPSDSMYTFHLQ